MAGEVRPSDDAERALRGVLGRLADRDSRVRALAADETSDYLRGRNVDSAAAEAAVARLVLVAVADHDEAVQEAALNACGDAVGYYDLPLALFEPLVPLMAGLSSELIGYVLGILGATHDPAAREIIAPYASHSDPSVRMSAAEALVELAGRGAAR